MANGVVAGPSWDQLLNVGIGYVKESQPAWIFVGVTVALQVLQGVFATSPVVSGIIGLVALVAGIYLSLMLARHALTGEWGLRDTDHGAALRIFGMAILIGVGVGLLGALFVGALGVALGRAGFVLGFLVLAAAVLWVVARFGFYVPALAVGHDTSLGRAFEQSRPYWGRILAVMIGPGVIVLAIYFLLALLIQGFTGAVLAALIGGFAAAVGQAITIAAISYLYANFVQASRPA